MINRWPAAYDLILVYINLAIQRGTRQQLKMKNCRVSRTSKPVLKLQAWDVQQKPLHQAGRVSTVVPDAELESAMIKIQIRQV